jgi:hypothetical protein
LDLFDTLTYAEILVKTTFLDTPTLIVPRTYFTGCKKSSFLYFKHYNLAIYVVKFFETFYTHYFNSLEQDHTLESQRKFEKSIYAICSRNGGFGVFYSKTL